MVSSCLFKIIIIVLINEIRHTWLNMLVSSSVNVMNLVYLGDEKKKMNKNLWVHNPNTRSIMHLPTFKHNTHINVYLVHKCVKWIFYENEIIA